MLLHLDIFICMQVRRAATCERESGQVATKPSLQGQAAEEVGDTCKQLPYTVTSPYKGTLYEDILIAKTTPMGTSHCILAALATPIKDTAMAGHSLETESSCHKQKSL